MRQEGTRLNAVPEHCPRTPRPGTRDLYIGERGRGGGVEGGDGGVGEGEGEGETVG